MSIINSTLSSAAIQTAINTLTTSSDYELIALLSNAAASVSGGPMQTTVATVNDLPNIYTGNMSNGHVVFVTSINVPVLAKDGMWFGLDGRILRNDGIISSVWTWGRNTSGQLGTGNTTSRSSPGTTAGGGTNWSSMSAGNTHTAAIKTDGTLWTWGNNGNGQLGTGTVTSRTSPGTTAGGGTSWSIVSASQCHTAGIKTDGTLWTWGMNGIGGLGDGTITDRSSPGTTAGGGTNWSSVSAGNAHTAAIKTDGTLWTWGRNTSGQLGDGTITNRSSPGTTAGGGTTWISLSAGCVHAAGIKTDGTLWTWGAAQCGRLGSGNQTYRSSPGTTAGGGTNWSSVSAGTYHTAGIKTDGTLWTWGPNSSGQLGDGTATARSSPGTTAGGGTTWSSVSAGRYHTASVTSNGTLWTWGWNYSGQLGDGTITDRSSPGTTAGGGTNWSLVSAGNAHTAAIARCQP
jgi:alpha-tubulin suppressor-like RCC1 family protein